MDLLFAQIGEKITFYQVRMWNYLKSQGYCDFKIKKWYLYKKNYQGVAIISFDVMRDEITNEVTRQAKAYLNGKYSEQIMDCYYKDNLLRRNFVFGYKSLQEEHINEDTRHEIIMKTDSCRII